MAECEHSSSNANSLRSRPKRVWGAIHTSELDRSEIDLSPKRSECERSKYANWDRSKIADLNECEHFLKANLDRSQIVIQLRSILVWMAPEIDLNKCEAHFLKANQDRSKIDPSWISLSVQQKRNLIYKD